MTIKTFTQPYIQDTVIALCTVDAKKQIWVTYSLACSQEIVTSDFHRSQESKTLIAKIDKWAIENNTNLYSY
jgi:hypothetical protein